MKPREIRRVVEEPELVEGWLCVDATKVEHVNWIVFFHGKQKPRLLSGEYPAGGLRKGQWDSPRGATKMWAAPHWKAAYGSAALPKPGACERVRLEL